MFNNNQAALVGILDLSWDWRSRF